MRGKTPLPTAKLQYLLQYMCKLLPPQDKLLSYSVPPDLTSAQFHLSTVYNLWTWCGNHTVGITHTLTVDIPDMDPATW